jgi:hypothetical protein
VRAKEFITEAELRGQRAPLDPDMSKPMRDVFMLPGIRNNDFYKSYRLALAFARARAINGDQDNGPKWTAQDAMGPYAVVALTGDDDEALVDQALKMTDTPGGKIRLTTKNSEEPNDVNTTSPVTGFAGYTRR